MECQTKPRVYFDMIKIDTLNKKKDKIILWKVCRNIMPDVWANMANLDEGENANVGMSSMFSHSLAAHFLTKVGNPGSLLLQETWEDIARAISKKSSLKVVKQTGISTVFRFGMETSVQKDGLSQAEIIEALENFSREEAGGFYAKFVCSAVERARQIHRANPNSARWTSVFSGRMAAQLSGLVELIKGNTNSRRNDINGVTSDHVKNLGKTMMDRFARLGQRDPSVFFDPKRGVVRKTPQLNIAKGQLNQAVDPSILQYYQRQLPRTRIVQVSQNPSNQGEGVPLMPVMTMTQTQGGRNGASPRVPQVGVDASPLLVVRQDGRNSDSPLLGTSESKSVEKGKLIVNLKIRSPPLVNPETPVVIPVVIPEIPSPQILSDGEDDEILDEQEDEGEGEFLVEDDFENHFVTFPKKRSPEQAGFQVGLKTIQERKKPKEDELHDRLKHELEMTIKNPFDARSPNLSRKLNLCFDYDRELGLAQERYEKLRSMAPMFAKIKEKQAELALRKEKDKEIDMKAEKVKKIKELMTSLNIDEKLATQIVEDGYVNL